MRRNASKFESNRSKASALFESLEGRQLMSATLSPLGTLSVVGTNLNDTITVTRVASGPFIMTQVRENNVLTLNTPLLVSSISVSSLGGNDTVTIGANITTRCFINGGDGNDILNGGAGADVIDGAAGNDHIFAGAGDDLCRGGVGDDFIDCWTGNDIAFGGAGRDWMLGYDGNDRLYGEADDDFLHGENGDDYLNGGVGYDRSLGGAGNDYLDASDGVHDILDGGLGIDTAYIDPYDLWPSNVENVQFDLVNYSGLDYF